MKLEYFGATIIFIILGYMIGSVSWAIILSKFFHKEDVRKKGSHNAGATNTLRNYGVKTALLVFILDVSKPIIASGIAFAVKETSSNFFSGTLIQMAAFSAVIGHIYPIFFKFKGGKGASCLLGLFIVVNWILAIIGFIIFVILVKKSRFVSIGSIFASLSLVIFQIIFMYTPHMNDAWSNPIAREPFLWVNSIIISIAWIVVTFKHKGNIMRLINGTESRLKSSKEK